MYKESDLKIFFYFSCLFPNNSFVIKKWKLKEKRKQVFLSVLTFSP